MWKRDSINHYENQHNLRKIFKFILNICAYLWNRKVFLNLTYFHIQLLFFTETHTCMYMSISNYSYWKILIETIKRNNKFVFQKYNHFNFHIWLDWKSYVFHAGKVDSDWKSDSSRDLSVDYQSRLMINLSI